MAWGADDAPVWGEPEEKKMEPITLEAFEKLIADAYELKANIDALEEQKKSLQFNLTSLQAKILLHMEQHNKKSYKTQHGTVVAATKFSVRLPDTEEKQIEFYNYLRERGHFDNLISVHHAKLNSYYNKELEAAQERGDIDFKIPGIDEPKSYVQIQMRG